MGFGGRVDYEGESRSWKRSIWNSDPHSEKDVKSLATDQHAKISEAEERRVVESWGIEILGDED